jgi:hypothetical protein
MGAGPHREWKKLTQAIYYIGRAGQLLGIWLLVVDIVMAGPMGPSPRIFGAGVAVFLAGWGLTKIKK